MLSVTQGTGLHLLDELEPRLLLELELPELRLLLEVEVVRLVPELVLLVLVLPLRAEEDELPLLVLRLVVLVLLVEVDVLLVEVFVLFVELPVIRFVVLPVVLELRRVDVLVVRLELEEGCCMPLRLTFPEPFCVTVCLPVMLPLVTFILPAPCERRSRFTAFTIPKVTLPAPVIEKMVFRRLMAVMAMKFPFPVPLYMVRRFFGQYSST